MQSAVQMYLKPSASQRYSATVIDIYNSCSRSGSGSGELGVADGGLVWRQRAVACDECFADLTLTSERVPCAMSWLRPPMLHRCHSIIINVPSHKTTLPATTTTTTTTNCTQPPRRHTRPPTKNFAMAHWVRRHISMSDAQTG